MYATFHSGSTKELLEGSTNCEAGSIFLQNFQAEKYDLWCMWLWRRISNENITKMESAERHQWQLIAARVESPWVLKDLESTLGIWDEDTFDLVTRGAGKTIHV